MDHAHFCVLPNILWGPPSSGWGGGRAKLPPPGHAEIRYSHKASEINKQIKCNFMTSNWDTPGAFWIHMEVPDMLRAFHAAHVDVGEALSSNENRALDMFNFCQQLKILLTLGALMLRMRGG